MGQPAYDSEDSTDAALREQLRCKEIWVVGANRYRNPDEDVPADFETQRTAYYQVLNLPLEADRFVVGLQEEMRKALHTLDTGLARNPCVRINDKAGGWISVTPLTAQPERDRKRKMVDGLVQMHLDNFKASGAELLMGLDASSDQKRSDVGEGGYRAAPPGEFPDRSCVAGNLGLVGLVSQGRNALRLS